MTMRLTAVALLAVNLVPLLAQSPAAPPAFEVASVRRNTSGATRTSFSLAATGTVSITNAEIRVLILQAYQIDRFRFVTAVDAALLGGPKFDVQAKPPDDAPPGQQRLMLQTLLADRFSLRVHRETRPIPVYALTVAREGRLGPDLQPTDQDCQVWAAERRKNPQVAEPRDRNGNPLCILGPASLHPGLTVLGNAGPAAGIARQMQNFVDRLLVDATGLTGNFAWRLSFALNPLDSGNPSIYTAVAEQLGLKLEPRMAPYEVLVVDSVELPTSN